MKVTDDAAAAVSKRSAMTLFSDSTSHYSHRVRIVLAEKGVSVDLVEGVDGVPVPELGDLNPYNTMPTLIDRGQSALASCCKDSDRPILVQALRPHPQPDPLKRLFQPKQSARGGCSGSCYLRTGS